MRLSIAGVTALVLGACAAVPEAAPAPAPEPAPERTAPREREAGVARIRCAERSDCACTSHYTPIPSQTPRDAGSPGDCVYGCREGFCFAAQGPL